MAFELFKCDICDYESSFKANLMRHKSSKHERGLKTIRIFKCDECNYVSDRLQNINRHIKLVHNIVKEKRFKCNFCSFETNNKHTAKMHGKNVIQHQK